MRWILVGLGTVAAALALTAQPAHAGTTDDLLQTTTQVVRTADRAVHHTTAKAHARAHAQTKAKSQAQTTARTQAKAQGNVSTVSRPSTVTKRSKAHTVARVIKTTEPTVRHVRDLARRAPAVRPLAAIVKPKALLHRSATMITRLSQTVEPIVDVTVAVRTTGTIIRPVATAIDHVLADHVLVDHVLADQLPLAHESTKPTARTQASRVHAEFTEARRSAASSAADRSPVLAALDRVEHQSPVASLRPATVPVTSLPISSWPWSTHPDPQPAPGGSSSVLGPVAGPGPVKITLSDPQAVSIDAWSLAEARTAGDSWFLTRDPGFSPD